MPVLMSWRKFSDLDVDIILIAEVCYLSSVIFSAAWGGSRAEVVLEHTANRVRGLCARTPPHAGPARSPWPHHLADQSQRMFQGVCGAPVPISLPWANGNCTGCLACAGATVGPTPKFFRRQRDSDRPPRKCQGIAVDAAAGLQCLNAMPWEKLCPGV